MTNVLNSFFRRTLRSWLELAAGPWHTRSCEPDAARRTVSPLGSVYSTWPLMWVTTQRLGRHSKHLLADWLINSSCLLTPSLYCVVSGQMETIRNLHQQARSTFLWPKKTWHVYCSGPALTAATIKYHPFSQYMRNDWGRQPKTVQSLHYARQRSLPQEICDPRRPAEELHCTFLVFLKDSYYYFPHIWN